MNFILGLQKALCARVLVENLCHCGFQTSFVHTTFACGDVVYVGNKVFGVTVCVLEGKFQLECIVFACPVQWMRVQSGLVFVEVLDKIGKTTLVAEIFHFGATIFVGAIFVRQSEGDTFVQKCKFLQALGDNVVVHFDSLEYARIGHKRDG